MYNNLHMTGQSKTQSLGPHAVWAWAAAMGQQRWAGEQPGIWCQINLQKESFSFFPPIKHPTILRPILLRLVKSSKRGPGVFPHSQRVSVVKEVPSPKLDLQKKYPKVALMQQDTCFFMFHTSPRLHPGQHC